MVTKRQCDIYGFGKMLAYEGESANFTVTIECEQRMNKMRFCANRCVKLRLRKCEFFDLTTGNANYFAFSYLHVNKFFIYLIASYPSVN